MKLLLSLLAAALINVIPEPVSVQVQDGFFNMSRCKNRIHCTIDPDSGIAPEGYTLTVTRNRVKIVASDKAGLFYAKQTLNQLVQPDGKVPCVKIVDYPRFPYRGFHIDPCRHFLPVEEVKKQIDIMAGYKLNRMHWHLTDDQGWRIEIKKYPKLTEVGAWRTEFDGKVYGGYYTQDEIREVVAYAAERCMTVVPEIEMPGHAISAIRAYPRLSCTGEEVKTFYTWGTPDISLCVGKESTFEFLDDVIAEVVQLVPSEYIHIGGDECRKNRWEKCPLCQARIKELGLVSDDNGTAEEKLQSYAVGRMEGILAKYGRKLIGWDEILEGGLTPGATVMSWRGEQGGIKAASEGHDVIMTPGSDGMYFDHYQGDPKVEPASIGHYTTLEKVYSYDPVPAELKAYGKGNHVKGVQCNNWSEYFYSDSHREYMLFPRAFALAEIAWTPLDRKDWESFRRRVDYACRRLDERGVNYHVPIPEQPDGSCDKIAFMDKTTVELKTTRPEKIVYTLDGSEPTADSQEYTGPVEFTGSAVMKTASVTSYGRLSTVRTIDVRKMDPMPALPESEVFGGIRTRRTDGKFLSIDDLKGSEWRDVASIERLRDLVTLETYDRNLPDSTRFYAAEGELCFNVRKTGVYRFASDTDAVYIDGQLIIDNSREPVKRTSRYDTELVLEAGVHKVKAVFIFNIVGGWNDLRNKTDVNVRRPGESDWHSLKPVQL